MLRAGARIDVGGARAETLLALLALRFGAPVSADSLIEEVWAGEPPEGAATTLRSYVSRLRSALGPGASIERVTGGYVLAVAPDAIDVTRFESLAREALALRDRSRHRRAADVLRTALGLWRGEPFAGIARDGTLGAEAGRLEELYLNALEARIASDLELGRDAELIDELEALVAEHPFRERLWLHLMLALYRAGRQGDALAAYHRARSALDEQLGIEPGDALRALETAILRQEVPPPAALPASTSIGLPAQLTSLVGRGRELAEIQEALLRSRLVTLVGIGGVGKTRLALETARRAATDLVDEVVVVDLAPLTDSALVRGHAAAAFGIRGDRGDDVDAALARRTRSADVLLLLDNCEHVLEAAGTLANELLVGSPSLRVLATSREILDVPGEAVYHVAPLGVPGADDGDDAIRESEAVRLLVDRATLSRHGLQMDATAYETAARICRELEGLPLAIELAAARAKVLSLHEIAARLGDRFELLVSNRRLTAARHRTLREAMDWSYELLGPDEQRLLARLSVFPGGATVTSVAAVCLDGDEAAAEGLIERLVDASLVMPIETSARTRFRLLDTVRQYAAERVPQDERESLQRRHAELARDLAGAANLALETSGKPMDFALVRAELPTIRGALEWTVQHDPALGLEIACALERFWVTNLPHEGMAIFDALLDASDLPDAVRARGHRCRGGCRYTLGSFEAGVDDYERALAIYRRLGQRADVAHLLHRLALDAGRVGDMTRARSLFEEAAAVGGDDRYVADGYVGTLLEADIIRGTGDVDGALATLRRGADLAGRAYDIWWRADILLDFADVALDAGRPEDAGPAARESLALSREIANRQSCIYGLAVLAREAATHGLARRAGRLWGGLEAELERNGFVGQWETQHHEELARVAALAGPGFQAGVVEGRQLSFDAAIDEALTPP